MMLILLKNNDIKAGQAEKAKFDQALQEEGLIEELATYEGNKAYYDGIKN